jgi:aryl-alcohol dehydrogenase-like predicted oxidoreductase
LGFWHNFGDDKPLDVQRAVARRAFDLGITHFDLANNYGPPLVPPRSTLAASCARTSGHIAMN